MPMRRIFANFDPYQTRVSSKNQFVFWGHISLTQTRWSTIEKEAYTIYWALLRLDDLVGGVHFKIRTVHRNLLFMNIHGSRKVLQWKLNIQHYDATIDQTDNVQQQLHFMAGKCNGWLHIFDK